MCTIHSRLPDQLQAVLDGSIPEWLVMGRTTLIQKDKKKGPIPSNYRPITCLPTIWKLLTSIMSNVVRKHLTDNDLLFPEQKGVNRAVEEPWIIYVWIRLFYMKYTCVRKI